MKKTLIVVAGGRGERMGAALPKQFLPLGGRPVLMHTIELFHRYDSSLEIILGLPEEYFDYWKEQCRQMDFDIPHLITPGGKTRFHTVKRALETAGPYSIVAIHDAVRPLVSRNTIARCFDEAGKTGAAIPCVNIPESLREIRQGVSAGVDRSAYRLVQTPQVFHHDILVKAYNQEYEEGFTDDAGVVEKAGYTVSLVEGNPENLKITTPEDMIYAESILESLR